MEKKKPSKPPGGNVVQMPLGCPAEGCGKKRVRSTFCAEHFEWFKEGLISRDGAKPKDFDKKYQAYTRRKSAA